MEQPASPFLILYFDLLPASAFAKPRIEPRIATDDAAVAVQIIIIFLVFLFLFTLMII